jgi:hypothetical protein
MSHAANVTLTTTTNGKTLTVTSITAMASHHARKTFGGTSHLIFRRIYIPYAMLRMQLATAREEFN